RTTSGAGASVRVEPGFPFGELACLLRVEVDAPRRQAAVEQHFLGPRREVARLLVRARGTRVVDHGAALLLAFPDQGPGARWPGIPLRHHDDLPPAVLDDVRGCTGKLRHAAAAG